MQKAAKKSRFGRSYQQNKSLQLVMRCKDILIDSFDCGCDFCKTRTNRCRKPSQREYAILLCY